LGGGGYAKAPTLHGGRGPANHDAHALVNFYLDKTAILVFRSGPPEKPRDARR